MYQWILNELLWNDWRNVTYSEVHGSSVVKALLFLSVYSYSLFYISFFSVSLEKDLIFDIHLYIIIYIFFILYLLYIIYISKYLHVHIRKEGMWKIFSQKTKYSNFNKSKIVEFIQENTFVHFLWLVSLVL